MATIDGHYELASRLLAAAPTSAGQRRGATPLYGVLNMERASKARHHRPASYMQHPNGYPELADVFLKAGVRRERAAPQVALVHDLEPRSARRRSVGCDAFWLAAYTLDIPAMKLL